MHKKGISAEDLFQMKSVTDPKLSPDGSMVIYVQTTIDERKNTSPTYICIA